MPKTFKKKVIKKRPVKKSSNGMSMIGKFARNGLSLVALGTAVHKLQQLINVEKKRIDGGLNGAVVGQLATNATGTYTIDVTPVPVSGSGFNQRTGSSIKLVSGFHEFTFINQSVNNHTTRLSLEYWMIKGTTQVASTFLSQIYQVNPATGLIDYMSEVDPDYFGTGKLVLQKLITIPAPQYLGQLTQKIVTVPMKLQHHIRFNQDTITIDDGQLILIIRADSGNTNSGIYTGGGNVLVATGLSACSFNYNQRWYYVDN